MYFAEGVTFVKTQPMTKSVGLSCQPPAGRNSASIHKDKEISGFKSSGIYRLNSNKFLSYLLTPAATAVECPSSGRSARAFAVSCKNFQPRLQNCEKRTLASFSSILLSVGMEPLGCHWMDFD